MGKVDKELAIEMRRQGMSFPEIGEHFGVSKQYISALLKNCVRARMDCETIEMIPYKGLYDFMMANKKVTISSLSRTMWSGNAGHTRGERVRRFLQGQNVSLPKSAYDRLMAYTGMTYEQLFELREGFDG